MRTALVTGASGFIGSHLVDALLERNYRVRGLDNLQTGNRENLDAAWKAEEFEFFEGDIRNEDIVERAVAGTDSVFHLAADISVQGSIDSPSRTTEINCGGTATVIEAARDKGVEEFVLASSAAVYGSTTSLPVSEDDPLDPESPYALSKRYGEQLAAQVAERNPMNCVSLRFFNVYGPRQDPGGEYAAVIPAFIERLLDGQPPVIYGDGEQSRDFVYVGDVVAGLIAGAERSPEYSVVNLGCGRRITINELASRLNEVIGTDLEPEYGPAREGEVRHSGADISRAREVLGFEPAVEFVEGLEETVRYFER